MFKVGDRIRVKDDGPFCQGLLGEVLDFGYFGFLIVQLDGETLVDYYNPREIELVGDQP